MERYYITMGNFLKNAGIVALKYMLDMSSAVEGEDYGISDDGQSIWINIDFAVSADWTDIYFKACIECFGEYTSYTRILQYIRELVEEIRMEDWKADKKVKENLKFINDKLLAASMQTGFENIKNRISNPETYLKLKASKLNVNMPKEELINRLEELRIFLEQSECKDTFIMKGVIYNYINKFWNGRCFLGTGDQARNDMREEFENYFSEPFRQYLKSDHSKFKETCIECTEPIGRYEKKREKTSIAFMNDMADDLGKKKSAFWNCKVDAFLCPVCAFLYASSPLGFRLSGNKFSFINTNTSVNSLVAANNKLGEYSEETTKGEDEKYTAWFARMLNRILHDKLDELNNIQVIIRGTQESDKYEFAVISRDALLILKQDNVVKALEYLEKHHQNIKKGKANLNIHEHVVMNVLKFRSQKFLLNKILRESIDNPGLDATAYWVYKVLLWTDIVHNNKENGGKVEMNRNSVMNSGYELRKALLASKGAKDDDCIRGTIYQLINAVSTGNSGKFMDVVLRLYSTCKVPADEKGQSQLLVPREFVNIMNNQELFEEYGYAFLLGLKGSNSKFNDKDKTEVENGK